MSDASEATTYLSDTDIVILNAARAILRDLSDNTPHTWRGGVAQARLTIAADSIFDALSAVSNYLEQPMTEDQIHGSRTSRVLAAMRQDADICVCVSRAGDNPACQIHPPSSLKAV